MREKKKNIFIYFNHYNTSFDFSIFNNDQIVSFNKKVEEFEY